VVADIPGHTVNLAGERCKIAGKGYKSMVIPNLHTVEVDMSPVVVEDKIGLAVQSPDADTAVP
jgi:hypothetical protein